MLQNEKIGLYSGTASSTSVTCRAHVHTLRNKQKQHTDATIPALHFPELTQHLPEVVYIWLGTNPLNTADLAHNGQGMPASGAVQLVQAFPIDSQ